MNCENVVSIIRKIYSKYSCDIVIKKQRTKYSLVQVKNPVEIKKSDSLL